MKRVSSLSPMKKSTFDRKEDEYFRPISIGAQSEPIILHIARTGPQCDSSKKAVAAAAFSQSSEEDLDLDKQVGNDRESMWLSSDCSSPSTFFREYRWSDSNHSNKLFSPSWLSLLARINPLEAASDLPTERASRDEEKTLQEDMKDEDIVTWLRSSATSYANARDFSVSSSEGAESCCGNSCEESPSDGNSSTPLAIKSDSSQSSDLERIGCGVSLLNLDGYDCRLTPGTDPRLACFLSAFPSPSYKSSWGYEFLSSNSRVSTPSEGQTEISGFDYSSGHASEAVELEDLNSDEPLFWPFEIEWSSEETWNYFSMSPRNGIGITNFGTPPDSVTLRQHDRNMDIKEGERRRLVFSSGSAASKIMQLKQRYNKGVRRTNTLPSRLSSATKSSEKIVPLNMKYDAKPHSLYLTPQPKNICRAQR